MIERDYVVVQKRSKQTAMGEWHEVELGDVCTKIGSGATPRGGQSVYLEDGPYALIRSQNIYNAGFTHDGLAFISDDQADALSHVEVLPNECAPEHHGGFCCTCMSGRSSNLTGTCEPTRNNRPARSRKTRPIILAILFGCAGSSRYAPILGGIGWHSKCTHKAHDPNRL